MVLTIVQEPELGQLLDQGNNIFTYIPPPGLDVTVSFIYLVCNDLCEDWCTQATIALTPFSILPPREDPPIAAPRNVITPNGDGIGDALVIPNFNDIAGNIKLTVVNRWGDVVFLQYPYDNNWQGTNSSGQDLPEGTYYFLLELASGGAEALDAGGARTGSVTILR
jgi:large repetitive protein